MAQIYADRKRHIAAQAGGDAGGPRLPLCGRGGRAPLYARDGDADEDMCGHCLAVRARVFNALLGLDEGRSAA